VQIARELLKGLDKAIQQGPWQKGTLFQNMGKRLRHLREKLIDAMDEEPTHQQTTTSTSITQHHASKDPNYQAIYISLYNTDGNSLTKWEKIIAALNTSNTTRPIYQNEADLHMILRSKSNKTNDGYAIVYVLKTNILTSPADNQPQDKFEHPLLHLKPNAISPNNIAKFIHKSRHYLVKNGKLYPQVSNDN